MLSVVRDETKEKNDNLIALEFEMHQIEKLQQMMQHQFLISESNI